MRIFLDLRDFFIKPKLPVRFRQIILPSVEINLCIVELWSVPTTDPVVSTKVPHNGVLVGLALVPLGEQEHVLAVLVCEPGDRLLCVQGLIVPGGKVRAGTDWRVITELSIQTSTSRATGSTSVSPSPWTASCPRPDMTNT